MQHAVIDTVESRQTLRPDLSQAPRRGSIIRALTDADIDQVAQLYQRAFRHTEAPASVGLRDAFRELFLSGPLAAPDRPSLVRVDSQRGITGFIGALTRSFTLDGQLVRGVAASQLMVDPASADAALAGLALIGGLLAGPQDFTFSDGSTELAARLWRRRGGVGITFHSLEWTHVLRPVAYLAGRLGAVSGVASVLGRAVPLAQAMDHMAGLGVSRWSPSPGPLEDREASPEEYLACLCEGHRESLLPLHEPRAFAWQMAHARTTRRLGDLRMRVVTEGRQVIGGYCHFARSGGVSQVLHLTARSRALARAVLTRLWWDAWQAGAVAVSGQADEAFRSALQESHTRFELGDYGFVAHARDPRIVAALQNGDNRISRLDGEWWTRLGIDRSLDW